jgi:hypothetical protein
MLRYIYVIITFLAASLLSSCNQRAADLAPDAHPQVAIASINGVNTRSSVSSTIYVPATSIYPVDVEVTASDETLVTKVELFVNDGSVGVLEPTKAGKAVDFKNPFKFTLANAQLLGTAGQLTPAKVSAIVTDNAGQTSQYELNVLVDATPPVVEIASITGLVGATAGSLQGTVLVFGQAFDPESSIAIDAFNDVEVRAYLDGDSSNTLNLSSGTNTPQTAFSVFVKDLEDGVHSVTLFARNGAGVFSSTTKSFVIDKPTTTPTP